ncbi:hypothetical protein IHE45_19G051600 [Dioscorea alata]|uniref:Uncharacterized protein n=1 Tax=Dioscorea alata TaxID=55571 RepID=A0ACB7TY27_DIOAL|nr:hypothetical protein IHE45_19G051600 [Dioscorea alata]
MQTPWILHLAPMAVSPGTNPSPPLVWRPSFASCAAMSAGDIPRPTEKSLGYLGDDWRGTHRRHRSPLHPLQSLYLPLSFPSRQPSFHPQVLAPQRGYQNSF